MIIKKLVNSAVKAALIQGIVIDLKSKDEVPPAQEFRYGVDIQDGDKVTMTSLPEVASLDPYKLPFFFVSGILIGAGLGLKISRVVVIK